MHKKFFYNELEKILNSNPVAININPATLKKLFIKANLKKFSLFK